MAASINFKLILWGFLITSVVLLFSTMTISRPETAPRSLGKTETVKVIYAGTPSTGRYYDNALDGIIKPIGGDGTIEDIYLGDHNSNFVMVYLDLYSAYMAATLNNTVPGVVSMKRMNLSNSQVVTSDHLPCGDIFNERPVFIKGMTTGWVSFKVRPMMTKEAIFNLVK
jgi:hypothetical protein